MYTLRARAVELHVILCMSFAKLLAFHPESRSHLLFPPPSPACVYCLFFSAIVTTPLPDARKMGLSGKTFVPHISHKGSLWSITVLMEARDSHQLHAFFPVSCVDAGQASVRSGSGFTDGCPEKWLVVKPVSYTQGSKGPKLCGGDTTCLISFLNSQSKELVALKSLFICLTPQWIHS